MTERVRRTLALLCLAAILSATPGCLGSTVAHLRTDDAPNVPSANIPPESILVLPFTNVGRPYDVLGIVVAASSLGDSTGDRTFVAYRLLQKEAAALGANAIIDVSTELEAGFWAFAVKVSGMAVRLR